MKMLIWCNCEENLKIDVASEGSDQVLQCCGQTCGWNVKAPYK